MNAHSIARSVTVPLAEGVLALGLLLAPACGGGGGGGGGSAPATAGTGYGMAPATGPGDVQAFFPAAAGDQWFYNLTTTDSGATTASLGSLQVIGTTLFNTVQALDFRQTSSDGSAALDTYYFESPGGITFLGNGDPTDWLTSTVGPYVQLGFPVAAGPVADFTRTGYSVPDQNGDGRPETLSAHVTVTVADFETVAVPAGTFTGAAKVVSSITGTVTVSGSGAVVPFNSTQTVWAAPGVGVVKQMEDDSVASEVSQTLAEVRGYAIGGARHGMGLPMALSQGQLPGDSDTSDPGRGAVASNGQGFMAVTTWAPAAGGGRRLKASLFDGINPPVTVDATPSSATALTSDAIALAFDGSNYLAACSQNDNSGTYPPLLGVRIGPSGTVLDNGTGFVLAPAGGFNPAAAGDGAGGLVAYNRFDAKSGHHILYGVMVAADGTPGTEFTIMSDPGNSLYGCAVAFDGTNFLVVCRKEIVGTNPYSYDLMGARVSKAGAVLDTPPLTLATASATGYPALAFDGGNYLAAWMDTRNAGQPDIYAARVSPAGTLLDGTAAASGFMVDGGGTLGRSDPAVAFNGSDYLVCWSLGAYLGTGAPCITGVKVTPAGALDGAAFAVSGPPPANAVLASPASAASPQGSAVIWLVNNEAAGTVKEMDGVVAW